MFIHRKLLLTVLIIGNLVLFGGVFRQAKSQFQAQTAASFEEAELNTIENKNYGYSFQVPANWYKEMGVTHDRWFFLSDPEAVYSEKSESLHPPPPSGGLIYVEFAVDPVPNWLPVPEVRNPLVDEWGNATSEALIPLLPEGDWITVDGVPTLLVKQDLSQLKDRDGGPFVKATSVYILTERMVYYMWIAYTPPSVGDKAIAESNYEDTIARILDSFAINLEAPSVWRPIDQQ